MRENHGYEAVRGQDDVVCARAHPELTSGHLTIRPLRFSAGAAVSVVRSCALAVGVMIAIGIVRYNAPSRDIASADAQSCGSWEAIEGNALRPRSQEPPADLSPISHAGARMQAADRPKTRLASRGPFPEIMSPGVKENVMLTSLRNAEAVRCSARRLLFASGLFLLGAGTGQAASIPLACAAQDLRILTQIEEYGERGLVPAERLAMATSIMLVARAACAQGRTEVALAIYDLVHPKVILVALKR